MAIIFDPAKLEGVRGMTPSLAQSLIKVFPTAEELELVEPEALSEVITGMSVYSANAALAYAKLLREQQARRMQSLNSVESDDDDGGVGVLFVLALDAWVAKSMEKIPSQTVLLGFGPNTSAQVTIRDDLESGFRFSMRREDAEFFMDFVDAAEMRDALDAMGEPFAGMRVKWVLDRLKLYAERYQPLT